MDFTNEPYVRLYVRDSATWKRLGFDGQTCLMHLLRRANIIGVIELGDIEPWQAATLLCDVPEALARSGVDKLIQLGCVQHADGKLVFPRYLEAQRAAASDAQRKRESRARETLISGNAVTNRDSILPESDAELETVLQWDAVRGARRRLAGSGPEAAARGAAWLSKVTGLEPYSYAGRWYESLRQLGGKPPEELAAAAPTLKRQAERVGADGILTPQHVLDYWQLYKAGKAPGGAVNGNGQRQPLGQSEIDAARAESERCKRAFSTARTEHERAAAQEQWLAADRKLREAKERFGWNHRT